MTAATLPSLRCGCGLYSLAGVAEITVDDVTHRPGRPCGATPARPAPERAGRAGDQPMPLPGAGEDILLVLSRRILERRATGVRRYGRPLQAFNGRAAALDLEDEMLDGAAYARQVGLELDRLEKAVVALSRRLRGADAEFGSVEAALELAAMLEARP